MLESDGVLKTWRIRNLPENGSRIAMEQLGDHRVLYLTYEGPLSGNRGSVTCWDRGEYQEETNNENQIEVILKGGKLKGKMVIEKKDNTLWSGVFEPPEFNSGNHLRHL